tara:strand:+ start:312 stop:476 length:165 start_codon:yes stop_codon:yes gene_type:complete
MVVPVEAVVLVVLEEVRHKVTPVVEQATEMMVEQHIHLEQMIRVVVVEVLARSE